MTRLAPNDSPPFATLAQARAHYRQVSARLQQARAPQVAPPAAAVDAPARPVLREDVPALAIGAANVVVVRALVAVATGKVDGPLVICGPAGSGKSHHAALARAICTHMHVVDESDGSPPPDRTRLVLFSEAPIFDLDRHMQRACRGAAALRLGRFDAAQATTIAHMMIEQTRQRLPGFGLAPEVVDLVTRGVAEGHTLAGRIKSLALCGADPSTSAEAAGHMLPEMLPQAAPGRPTVKSITKLVAARYGVAIKDVLSQRRASRLVRARWIVMTLAHRLTAHSLNEIGRAMGGRDHSSVAHGIRTIGDQIESDPDLQAELAGLEEEIHAMGGASGD